MSPRVPTEPTPGSVRPEPPTAPPAGPAPTPPPGAHCACTLRPGYLIVCMGHVGRRLAQCPIHGSHWADTDCPHCTLESIDAAAALEARYRAYGGSLVDALDEARDLLQRHQPAVLNQLERWARLSHKVKGV